MKTRRLIALIVGIGVVAGAVASSATLASSGGTKAPKKTYTFYLVAGIASDPFYLTMKKGAQAAAAPLAFTNVSTDNPAGGRAAADALAKAIGQKGTVAGISVTPGISTTDQRKEGFEQELKKYSNIKYVGTQFDNDDETKASQETAA